MSKYITIKKEQNMYRTFACIDYKPYFNIVDSNGLLSMLHLINKDINEIAGYAASGKLYEYNINNMVHCITEGEKVQIIFK